MVFEIEISPLPSLGRDHADCAFVAYNNCSARMRLATCPHRLSGHRTELVGCS